MRSILIICSVFAIFGWASESQAQFNSSVFNRRASFTAPSRSVQANITSRPSVSPYLALTDLSGNGGDFSSQYFTNVRPRLESQQQQQQQSRSIQLMQRDVSQMRSAAAQRSQTGPRATGHPTRFGMYMQYYPGLR